ncbi:hypothetical protein [Geoglobus ahangari]
MSRRILSVPHHMFEVEGRVFWVDAHFPPYLSEKFRVSAPIRAEVGERPEGEVLSVAISPQELLELFRSLRKSVEEDLRSVRSERAKKMGRWSLARILLIPRGHSRKIAEDEALAKRERELRMSLEILKKVSKSRYLGKTGYLDLTIEEQHPADPVYSELLEVDEGFKKRFLELIQ